MPPDVLDFSKRAQLTELMDEPCSREEMRACLRDLERLNRLLLGYRPVLQFLETLRPAIAMRGPLRILDVGCGYGDTLRRVARWARAREIAVELTGIDLNPDATAVAAEATRPGEPIRFIAADVFAYQPAHPPHIIVSALFTHHLDDAEVVRFLRWMEERAEVGWCVNDLSRHPLPWRLLRWFTRLLRLHPFVQHDGPVSIARAFRPEDWQRYCAAAGLSAGDVEIRGFTPGRLRVSRRKLA
jgi:SAM-dependent methyltransferase